MIRYTFLFYPKGSKRAPKTNQDIQLKLCHLNEGVIFARIGADFSFPDSLNEFLSLCYYFLAVSNRSRFDISIMKERKTHHHLILPFVHVS